jgi:uncharacterized protein (TIGR03086 family)
MPDGVDVLGHDERASARVAQLIDGIPGDTWPAATPCAEWTVRDLVTHLIAGNVKYAGIARGDDFMPGVPDVVIGDDPAATYRQSISDMLDAWRTPGALDREIMLPRAARGRAEVAAWIHLAETLAHGWDLAVATSQEPGFHDEDVAACLAECRSRMPAHRFAGSPFADAVDPPEGRALIDQLAAYLGRPTSVPS